MTIPKLSLCLLAGSALAASSLAAPLSTTVTPPTVKMPKAGGLSINLETSAVSVVIPTKPAATTTDAGPTTTGKTPPPPAIVVSAQVANKGKDPVAITFESAEAAIRQITFNLFDSTGELVWSSDADLEDGADVEAVLGRGKVWRKLVRVPLVLKEGPLAVGSYTLQAVTGLYSNLAATAPLEVLDATTTSKPPTDERTPPPPPSTDSSTPPPGSDTGGTPPPPPPPPPREEPTSSEGGGETKPPPPPPTDGPSHGSTGTTAPPPPPPPPPTPGTDSATGTPPPPRPTGTNPPPRPPRSPGTSAPAA